MAQLEGLEEYMQERAAQSVFHTLTANASRVTWHLHGERIVTAAVADHSDYEATLQPAEGDPLTVHKTEIKFIHAPEHGDAVQERLKIDKEVRSRKLDAILRHHGRHFVKNKTLYVIMRERTVVKCTLLEGELLRGLVAGFSRYEMDMHLKGGIPVTVFRHAILDLCDKEGRGLLKEVQDQRRDWQKSALYVGGGPQR